MSSAKPTFKKFYINQELYFNSFQMYIYMNSYHCDNIYIVILLLQQTPTPLLPALNHQPLNSITQPILSPKLSCNFNIIQPTSSHYHSTHPTIIQPISPSSNPGLGAYNPQDSTVRLSHMTFWGHRKDVFISYKDIIPPVDIGEDSSDVFFKVKRWGKRKGGGG